MKSVAARRADKGLRGIEVDTKLILKNIIERGRGVRDVTGRKQEASEVKVLCYMKIHH